MDPPARHWGATICTTCHTGYHPRHIIDDTCVLCVVDLIDTATAEPISA